MDLQDDNGEFAIGHRSKYGRFPLPPVIPVMPAKSNPAWGLAYVATTVSQPCRNPGLSIKRLVTRLPYSFEPL